MGWYRPYRSLTTLLLEAAKVGFDISISYMTGTYQITVGKVGRHHTENVPKIEIDDLKPELVEPYLCGKIAAMCADLEFLTKLRRTTIPNGEEYI